MKEIRRRNLEKVNSSFESQRVLADVIGIAATYLNQLLTGHRGIGEGMARKIELALKKPEYWLDCEHELSEDNGLYVVRQTDAKSNYISFDLLDIEAAAGFGKRASEFPEIIQQINVLESWAKTVLGGDLSRIRLISANGTSMHGTIENGDVLFVDSAITAYDGEGIYVIARDSGDIQVKRLQKLHGNMLAIISDNKLFDSEKLGEEEANSVRVCGRVLAAWTLKKFW